MSYQCNSGGCAGASYSFSSALPQTSYSSGESPANLGYESSSLPQLSYGSLAETDGYSALPSELDYKIADALKDMKFEEKTEATEMLPVPVENGSAIKVIPNETEIVPVESDIKVMDPDEEHHNQMMQMSDNPDNLPANISENMPSNPSNMPNLPSNARVKSITQVEEQIIIKRRLRRVQFGE